MATATVRSRILEFFNPTLLKQLNEICRTSTLSDNNQKVDAMLSLLDAHNVDYVELGPGTNRLAILIDGYVFKIALDRWGKLDNLNEYSISKELQPFVAKTYETNELISVHEYVTVITSEEFDAKKTEIQKILALLSESYLLGDVGTVKKNFCNWGYRDDGQLVILDFAYIYRISGEELLCPKCRSMIDYDLNFHNLKCSNLQCGRKFTFIDIRRKITQEAEMKEIQRSLDASVIATEPYGYIEIDDHGSAIKYKDEDGNVYQHNNEMQNEEEKDMKELEELCERIESENEEGYAENLFYNVLENIDSIMNGNNTSEEILVDDFDEDEFDDETDAIDEILNELNTNSVKVTKTITNTEVVTVENLDNVLESNDNVIDNHIQEEIDSEDYEEFNNETEEVQEVNSEIINEEEVNNVADNYVIEEHEVETIVEEQEEVSDEKDNSEKSLTITFGSKEEPKEETPLNKMVIGDVHKVQEEPKEETNTVKEPFIIKVSTKTTKEVGIVDVPANSSYEEVLRQELENDVLEYEKLYDKMAEERSMKPRHRY